jgi:hypothetical protein
MCERCGGETVIAGRVDHVRMEPRTSWTTLGGESVTYVAPVWCWTEGSHIPCPDCRPDVYGSITKVETRTR